MSRVLPCGREHERKARTGGALKADFLLEGYYSTGNNNRRIDLSSFNETKYHIMELKAVSYCLLFLSGGYLPAAYVQVLVLY